jgi:hypothetical protein
MNSLPVATAAAMVAEEQVSTREETDAEERREARPGKEKAMNATMAVAAPPVAMAATHVDLLDQ